MKRFFLLITVVFFVYNYINAQITIHDYSGLDLTNATADLPLDEDYHFQITNTGSSNITFVVEVTAFSVPADANGIAVCACGACTPISSTPTTIGAATSLDAGDTYGEEGNADYELADVNYSSNGSTGDASITVKVYEQDTPSNYAEFTLSKTTGLSDLNINNISIYPNPAINYFVLNVMKNMIGGNIVLTNILGKVILKHEISSKKETIDISNFDKGIYFYSILKDNGIIETKKLIIK